MTMLGYLADALTERGHDLLLSRVIPKDPDWLNPVVDSGRVDGVILIGQSDQIDVIEKVASRYLPLVAWGANLPDTIHCSVGSDNRKGGEIATRLEGCPMALSAANLADKLSILPQALVILSICYSVG